LRAGGVMTREPAGRARRRAARLFEAAQSFGLVVLLFGLPFSEAAKSAGLGLAVLGFAGKTALGRRPDFGGRALPLALASFYAAAVLSVVFARPELRAAGELFTLAMALLPFFLVADACSRPTRRLFFMLVVIAGAAVAATLAYFDHMFGEYSRLVLDSIENAIPAAEYLAAAAVAAVAMLMAELAAPVAGPILGLAAGVTGLALLMTKSRGPVIGAVAGGMLAAGTMLRRKRVAVAILALAVVAAIAFAVVNPEARVTRWGEAGRTGVENRLAIWSETLDRACDSPVTGNGIGSYSRLGIVYSDEILTLRQDNAHNTMLQIACDTGVLGSGTFLVFLVLAVVGLVRSVRTSVGMPRAVSVASLGGVVVLLVAGFFSVVIDAEPGILFFSLAAMGQAREVGRCRSEGRG
jgi:O-antigen ligase